MGYRTDWVERAFCVVTRYGDSGFPEHELVKTWSVAEWVKYDPNQTPVYSDSGKPPKPASR